MAIDTFKIYNPKMKHPLYAKITTEQMNDYTLFNEYEIRIPDEENGDDGPFNYIHDAILVSKNKVNWSEIPDLFKGYVSKSRSMEQANQMIHPAADKDGFDDDQEVVVLVFLNEDKAKDFIVSDDKLHTPQSISTETLEEYES